jgi:GNAT superfamily N-acetyltransferase
MRIEISEGYAAGCIGRITQLHAAYYAAASGFGLEFEAKVATELGRFAMAYTPGRDGLWLARGPEIEGSVAIDGSKAAHEGAHLRWFICSDALRGQGVGRRLLQEALAFADQRGYGTVHLWTFAGLDAARHLYEAHGFRLVQEGAGSQWGKEVTEQRFERPGRPAG